MCVCVCVGGSAGNNELTTGLHTHLIHWGFVKKGNRNRTRGLGDSLTQCRHDLKLLESKAYPEAEENKLQTLMRDQFVNSVQVLHPAGSHKNAAGEHSSRL